MTRPAPPPAPDRGPVIGRPHEPMSECDVDHDPPESVHRELMSRRDEEWASEGAARRRAILERRRAEAAPTTYRVSRKRA
jgi:hypothetical protein